MGNFASRLDNLPKAITAILKQAGSKTPVPELRPKHGKSNVNFYKWRSEYGALKVTVA